LIIKYIKISIIIINYYPINNILFMFSCFVFLEQIKCLSWKLKLLKCGAHYIGIPFRFLSWCKLPNLIFRCDAKYMLYFYILAQITYALKCTYWWMVAQFISNTIGVKYHLPNYHRHIILYYVYENNNYSVCYLFYYQLYYLFTTVIDNKELLSLTIIYSPDNPQCRRISEFQ